MVAGPRPALRGRRRKRLDAYVRWWMTLRAPPVPGLRVAVGSLLELDAAWRRVAGLRKRLFAPSAVSVPCAERQRIRMS